ncbi:MAG: hypothetical protein LBS69_12205 [Prevotellaceae bacterium]|jgi:hypothetical protein|nr:hypothetical protein [Prevotellaceae bacterium]
MEKLTTLQLQIILSALIEMPDAESEVIRRCTKSLINDFETLIQIRENKQTEMYKS